MQTSPYRGFGRPEATYIIERLIDKAARETGYDALALRLKKSGDTGSNALSDWPNISL